MPTVPGVFQGRSPLLNDKPSPENFLMAAADMHAQMSDAQRSMPVGEKKEKPRKGSRNRPLKVLK